jgi:CAAX protease family protein
MRDRTLSRALRVSCRRRPFQSICVDSASREHLTIAGLKHVAKLAIYFVAIVIVGALIAPVLFWSAQSLAAHGVFLFLAKYNFETFFHRALLVAAAVLLWPFLRITHVRSIADLGLVSNSRWARDVCAGILLAAIPLLCCAILLIALHVYSFRHVFVWSRLIKVLIASICVPLIEEAFFRGIILGVLLRTGRKWFAIIVISLFFAAIHFLKAPERTSAVVTWASGFSSIAHAFERISDSTMFAPAFATLFVIGCVLGVARVLTNSLWLPIGLHAGWIFASGVFSLLARQQIAVLPWLGKNLLVGIVPVGLAIVTWILMRSWLKYERASQV